MTEFLFENMLWAGLAAVSAAGLVVTFVRDGAKMIDHDAAVLLVKSEKGVFVDTRTVADFARGRIAQSRNIPATELKDRVSELDKFRERPVVLVCQNGMNSRKHAPELAGLGFKNVRALRGGMTAWRDAQLPVFKK